MNPKIVKIYNALIRNRFNSRVIKSMDAGQLWDVAQQMAEDAENPGWTYIDDGLTNFV